jgi:hypothetical protein
MIENHMSDRWLKCKDCSNSNPLVNTKSTARKCSKTGWIYAGDHTCHLDEDVREGKYETDNTL